MYIDNKLCTRFTAECVSCRSPHIECLIPQFTETDPNHTHTEFLCLNTCLLLSTGVNCFLAHHKAVCKIFCLRLSISMLSVVCP